MKKKQQKSALPKSRRRVIAEWSIRFALLVAILLGITAWQTRNMVASGARAPALDLVDLGGNPVSVSANSGKKVVLYFFAPWCTVCHASSGNVNALREAYEKEELAIYAVGLAWESKKELHRFADEHELTVPVLIGTDRTADAYRISSFPSVYILDEEHRVAHQLVGYTTEWGLRVRTALTGVL
jgi:peroxiredoxin